MQAIEFNTVMKNGCLKVPHHYPDWENQSVKVIVLLPVVDEQPPPNFWQALQIFRQQTDIADLYDEDIFREVRDRSPGREVLL